MPSKAKRKKREEEKPVQSKQLMKDKETKENRKDKKKIIHIRTINIF